MVLSPGDHMAASTSHFFQESTMSAYAITQTRYAVHSWAQSRGCIKIKDKWYLGNLEVTDIVERRDWDGVHEFASALSARWSGVA